MIQGAFSSVKDVVFLLNSFSDYRFLYFKLTDFLRRKFDCIFITATDAVYFLHSTINTGSDTVKSPSPCAISRSISDVCCSALEIFAVITKLSTILNISNAIR